MSVYGRDSTLECALLYLHVSVYVCVFVCSSLCPRLLATAPMSVLKVTSRRERDVERNRGELERGGVRGHGVQDTGSGERWRDQRQWDVQGCWGRGRERRKRKQRRERTEERGRGGTWEEQEGPGHVCMCVCLALAGREIARVRLAGRVCLCLAEEGCESKKALSG